MAGRSNLRAYSAAHIGLAILYLTGSASADTVRGQSRDLGIRFETAGGVEWCAPNVEVRLTADKASAFQPDTVPFLQMLGRIRAVVMDGCPATENLLFEGVVGRQPVFAGEMSRLTRWRRLIALDQKSHRPLCPASADEADCKNRGDAYVMARRLMRGMLFKDTEITSVLEPGNPDHLAWVSGPVTGKLRITGRSAFSGLYKTSAQFADAIMADLGGACVSEEGTVEPVPPRDPSLDLAQRGLLCRASGEPVAQNTVLVRSDNDRFYVFSFRAEGAEAETADRAAGHLLSAIKLNR
jgi:hypothetical protein